uniref:hypothetical protein n=1 Tax=Ndongobacter massiliensis TaxID=1871025 RepID=UPI000930DC54|nr:hypothetical protein [Ndongobacter massiliensis]
MLEDIRDLYRKTLKKIVGAGLSLGWLVLGLFLGLLAQQAISRLFAANRLGLFENFLHWLIWLAVYSYAAGLLENLLQMGHLRSRDFMQWNMTYTTALSQTYFLLYLVNLAFSYVLPIRLDNLGTVLLLRLLLDALCWPLFEETVFAGNSGPDAFRGLFYFWKQNWAQWLPITLLGMVGEYFNTSLLLGFALRGQVLLYLFFAAIAMALFLAARAFLFQMLMAKGYRARAFERRAR